MMGENKWKVIDIGSGSTTFEPFVKSDEFRIVTRHNLNIAMIEHTYQALAGCTDPPRVVLYTRRYAPKNIFEKIIV